MIKNKYIGVISIVLIVLSMILVFFGYSYSVINNNSLGKSFDYEYKLFDDSYVHEIDIQISEDSWNDLLENAIEEEYYVCDVEIDGTIFYNVGIRAKGNTSLSQIYSDDTTDRYSFKIKFDEYQDGDTCYGLDKLALNNTMSDTTYMKDYLTYDMMEFIGADTPLSSFMFIYVNGEPWGLYLGVECIDESFLERNYGNDYGELYKPESMNMGGDREIGGDIEFGFENKQFGGKPFDENDFSNRNNNRNSAEDAGQTFNIPMNESGNSDIEIPVDNMTRPNNKGMGNMFSGGGADLVYTDDNVDSYSTIFEGAKTDITLSDKARLINSLKVLSTGENLDTVLDVDNIIRYWVVHNFVCNGDSYTGNMLHNYYLYEKDGVLNMLPWDYNLAFGAFSMGGGRPSEMPQMDMLENGMPENGSDSNLSSVENDLNSVDNNSNMDRMSQTDMNEPNNEVMNPDNKSKDNNQEMDIIDEITEITDANDFTGNRPNFNMGFDSDATSIVNSLIDNPLSSASNDERPMWGKIIENEEYKEIYHKYYQDFIDDYFNSGYFELKIEKMYRMLLPYVKKDPTAFYTVDEFTKGVETLKEFCLLRAESIEKQLSGEIIDGSTENYVDASHISIDNMGTQNMGKDKNLNDKERVIEK